MLVGGGAGGGADNGGGGGAGGMGYAGSDSHSGGDGGDGIVVIRTSGDSEFCNARGPFNECVMNQTNNLQNQRYDVSSIFEARNKAVFEAFNGVATLNITNTSTISGVWKGEFDIIAENPRVEAGAKFRPQDGAIVVGR